MIADQLIVGCDYWPAATGLYMWHEFTASRIAADLAGVRAAGLAAVRVHLAWDAFMPTDRQVNRYRLRDLETLLDAAAEVSLSVVPVLFAQSFGDTVMLPRYAVDRRQPRPGVRVVCDGNVVSGGPRDLYGDPLMLEVATRWLDGLLGAFANHPAIGGWDLGHDPATTVRPRRIAQLAAWTAEMSGRVRAQQDSCWFTLGAADVFTARGVRLSVVAPSVDLLAVTVSAHQAAAALGDAGVTSGAVVFLTQLAQRLASALDASIPPLAVHLSIPNGDPEEPLPQPEGDEEARTWDLPLLDAAAAAAYASDAFVRVAEVGAAGIVAAAWSDTGVRTLGVPPCDRAPSLARSGLADVAGRLKPVGDAWSLQARRELDRTAPDPWPATLDVEAYYANLPESLRDLAAEWRRERDSAELS